MDPRSQLAAVMSLTPGPANTPIPPESRWTPTPGMPFGGIDRFDWKKGGVPRQIGSAPVGASQQDLDMITGVYNSMRARGELPF